MKPTFPQEDPELPVSPGGTPSRDAADNMVETREQFVERALAEYESPLVGYAYGFVHDLERARDIVQDTFIRLCQQDVAKVKDGLKTWLFTVCRNRALDVLRKESRVTPLDDDLLKRRATEAPSPDESLDQSERVAWVMRYLDRLSENQRTVILMKFRDGLSYQEICDSTGLSSGNVGFLIHTGLKRLRELLPSELLEP
ncbi:sigma-70 family RNA polymerase sigma factor [Luteolibacter arcticus]|uniref:Sigma-70 family RNA polymerase sigma factor n=1 Tax=Luteolibacter arcticus TaxID=1581411 RepID=A0ABT3GMF0_9BACT|nr:sigma-70 family RNA polymerase sigma factor [Luteolibacter arcticus]MCW1924691.1 sigma-70 family RNA polymerase sigma factor [Luteolibacter arcticus]